jgi:small subunit ribosomal protein S5
VRSEYDQKIIDTRRVTRVVSGGRRFSFSISIVIGDKKGSVGVGIGKAGDTALAIEKATRDAKKHMFKVKRTKDNSITHPVEAKVGSVRLTLKPAPGRGIVAGSSVRTVLEMAGVKDVGAKIYSRSKNKLGIARATMKALAEL